MVIQVETKTDLEKKIAEITPKLIKDQHDETPTQKIAVNGLKIASKAGLGQKCDVDLSSDEGCLKMAHMTPEQYQLKYHWAWNE